MLWYILNCYTGHLLFRVWTCLFSSTLWHQWVENPHIAVTVSLFNQEVVLRWKNPVIRLLMHQEHNSSVPFAIIQIIFAEFTASVPKSLCPVCVPMVVGWFVRWFCLALFLNRDSLDLVNNCGKKTLQNDAQVVVEHRSSRPGSATVKPLCHHPFWSGMEPWTPLGTRAPTSDLPYLGKTNNKELSAHNFY